MKLSFGKIFFIIGLLYSVAFAGGIEDDSGPEEVSAESTNDTQWQEENFPTLLQEYTDLAHNTDCRVTYSTGYVNDPDATDNLSYATWC